MTFMEPLCCARHFSERFRLTVEEGLGRPVWRQEDAEEGWLERNKEAGSVKLWLGAGAERIRQP